MAYQWQKGTFTTNMADIAGANSASYTPPLTVIAGFAQALSDGTATGTDATRAAQAIAEEAGRLERLVAELGAIERLQAGPAGLRLESIDAQAALEETAGRFRPGAAASHSSCPK